MASQNPYEILGVEPTSPDHIIKAAYRKWCMTLHPDRGGSEEQFKLVNWAYDLLKDPQRRQQYDRFGVTSENPNTEDSTIRATIAGMCLGFLIQSQDPFHEDILDKVRKHVLQEKAQLAMKVAQIRNVRERLHEGLKRFHVKEGKDLDNFIINALNSEIQNLETQKKDAEKEIALKDKILKMVDDFTYDMDPAVQATVWNVVYTSMPPTTTF